MRIRCGRCAGSFAARFSTPKARIVVDPRLTKCGKDIAKAVSFTGGAGAGRISSAAVGLREGMIRCRKQGKRLGGTAPEQ